MQLLYCGMTDFSVVDKYDTEITIYGDSSNSTISQRFIQKLVIYLTSISLIQLKDITVIEDYALSNLQISKFTLILPDTLTYIGKFAFQSCTVMNDVIVPSSVTHIGEGAFYGCSSLDHIYFKEDIQINYVPERFCYGSTLKSVGIEYKNGTRTDDDTTEFPKSITKINNNAFCNCVSMGHNLIIGDNITSIGDYAFYETLFSNIEIGSGINFGDNKEFESYEDGGYTTDRVITTPYTLYLSSKRQFRYKHFVAEEDSPAGTIYVMNKKEYEEEGIGKTYTYKLDDDDFKFCLQNSHLLVFKNGLLLPNTYYYLHSIVNNPINDTGIVFNVPIKTGDKIDIFYVTNDLKHLEVEYYDLENKERYLKNGDIKIARNNDTEYRVMGDQMYPDNTDRTNYIKLRSPLYAISSKHSTFVFLNGKKVRLDELEDISDTIMSINTDYATLERDKMNAVRLEVMNHLDTQDIIEQVYINDGLNHDDIQSRQFNSTDNPNVYKSTNLIKSIDLTQLESYAKCTLLDDILNDLSNENLNKLFYDYDTAKGPMTPYNDSKMNEPDFIKKDDIINAIIDEYYISEDPDDYIVTDTDNRLGTVFYIGKKDKVRIPKSFNDVTTESIFGTTFNNNNFIKKIVIPEGITSID